MHAVATYFRMAGSGKTTIARAFSVQKNVLHLNRDFVRSELGLLCHDGKEDKNRVCTALLAKTREAHLATRFVLVDGTFYKESIRGLSSVLLAPAPCYLLNKQFYWWG